MKLNEYLFYQMKDKIFLILSKMLMGRSVVSETSYNAQGLCNLNVELMVITYTHISEKIVQNALWIVANPCKMYFINFLSYLKPSALKKMNILIMHIFTTWYRLSSGTMYFMWLNNTSKVDLTLTLKNNLPSQGVYWFTACCNDTVKG